MIDIQLEKYVKNYLKGIYNYNWINYYIVVATNNYDGNQIIFVKCEDFILIYSNDDFIKKIKN